MKAQEIYRRLYSMGSTTKSVTTKKCLLILILISAFGTLELVSLSEKFQERSWPFSLCLSLFQSHFLDNLMQDKYLPIENDDLAVDGSKKFHTQFSIVNTGCLTFPPLSSQWEIFFVSINSSPYPSFFALLPLRSPPLFS
jgi:hypothetical protein